MYSPDGTNVYGLGGGSLKAVGLMQWAESCKIIFLGRHFLFTCSDTFDVGSIV